VTDRHTRRTLILLTVLAMVGLLQLTITASTESAATDAIGGASGGARAQPQQAAQDEFVPIGELPPEEQLPAAPLLVTAYAFVWVALIGYLWSIWRRVGRVELELAEVGRRLRKAQER